MKTIASLLSFFYISVFSSFGAKAPVRSIEDLSAEYADFLTNVTFQLRHADVIEDSLNSFRKAEDYSPDAMLKALVSIVERGHTTTNDDERRMARASINAMGCLQLTNALPILEEWTLGGGDMGLSSFSSYGEITGHDERYIELGRRSVEANTLSKSYYLSQLKMLLLPLDPIAKAYTGTHCQPLQEKSRLIMSRMLINSEEGSFEDYCGRERLLSKELSGYTNSLEHVKAQLRINDFLIQRKENIIKKSCYRFMGNNRKLSDEEWYRRATNSCQHEIARVMSLPEEERLNMTMILDAQIAAIEEAEARAARRAIWRRLLRNAALLLSIPVLVSVVIVLVRRKRR